MEKHVPTEVQAAFAHVKTFFPQVTCLAFDDHGRWLFSGVGVDIVFGDEVNVGILEAAADALDSLPAYFVEKPAGSGVLVCDVVDPEIPVRIPGTDGWSKWRITQNITDRWGEINDYTAATKPIGFLEDHPEALAQLQAQMWDEVTFVVRKDGQFGILYELEFLSKESEANLQANSPDVLDKLKPYTEVVAFLLAKLPAVASAYPQVQFAVPHEDQIVEGRPAIWAFVPDGALDQAQRKSLGLSLLGIAYD